MKKNKFALIFLFAELLGACSFFILYKNLTLLYPNIPNVIPQHYNIRGEADIFGSKEILWSDLHLYTMLYIGIGLINLIVFFIKKNIANRNNAQTAYNLLPVASLAIIRLLIMGLCGFLLLTEIENFQRHHSDNFLPPIFYSLLAMQTIVTIFLILKYLPLKPLKK